MKAECAFKDLLDQMPSRSPAPSTLHYPVPDVPYPLVNRKETFMQSTVLSTVIARPSLHTRIRSVEPDAMPEVPSKHAPNSYCGAGTATHLAHENAR